MFVAGCSFEHGVEPGLVGGGDEPTPDADPAGVPPASVACKYPDTALRLCLEFDDRKFTPMAFDASPYGLNAIADELTEIARGGQPAAATYWNSDMKISETPMLDISDAVTFEAWIGVPAYQSAAILNNDKQYALTMGLDGKVTCWAGTKTATSDPISRNTWHHVACTVANGKLSIHIDGAATRCESFDGSIPTSGTQGTRIVPGFVGGIDDIHIYARKLSAAEICSHADKTACPESCTDE
jgi:concanavalin A-like lectin/glucanase superfamily protein